DQASNVAALCWTAVITSQLRGAKRTGSSDFLAGFAGVMTGFTITVGAARIGALPENWVRSASAAESKRGDNDAIARGGGSAGCTHSLADVPGRASARHKLTATVIMTSPESARLFPPTTAKTRLLTGSTPGGDRHKNTRDRTCTQGQSLSSLRSLI